MKTKFFLILLLILMCHVDGFSQSECMDRYSYYDNQLKGLLSEGKPNVEPLVSEAKSDGLKDQCIEIDHAITKMLLYSGDKQKAFAYAKETYERDTENPYSNMFLAMAYETLGDTENAVAHARTAYELMPSNSFLKINYCSILANNGYSEEANANCKQ